MRLSKTYLIVRFHSVAQLVGWYVNSQPWMDHKTRIGVVFVQQDKSGWVVAQVTDDNGGERNLSPRGLTAREFDAWLTGVEYGAQQLRSKS